MALTLRYAAFLMQDRKIDKASACIRGGRPRLLSMWLMVSPAWPPPIIRVPAHPVVIQRFSAFSLNVSPVPPGVSCEAQEKVLFYRPVRDMFFWPVAIKAR